MHVVATEYTVVLKYIESNTTFVSLSDEVNDCTIKKNKFLFLELNFFITASRVKYKPIYICKSEFEHSSFSKNKSFSEQSLPST